MNKVEIEKRIVSCILILMLLFLSGCGASEVSENLETNGFTENVLSETAAEEASDTVEEPPAEDMPEISENRQVEAVYLGVKDYGGVLASEIKAEGAQLQQFLIDGETETLAVRNDEDFSIQNHLMEQHRYRVNIEGNAVTEVELLDSLTEYEPVICPQPGLRTLKNFLATAFEPFGTTLYVFGGAWNWQDDGSSVQSTTIGVSGTWVDFFNENDADYMYRDDAHPAETTYPFGGWNQYYYAGMDCSGFAGWTVYNTLNTENGNEGYVTGASRQAWLFDKEYGFGEWTGEPFDTEEDPLQPGDMISTPSHIWICVGKCDDGSIVAIHSTVTDSSTGKSGGGVQLSAINPDGNKKDCEAYRLACEYTEKYFPEWAERYPVVMKKHKDYVEFARSNEYVGRFRWNLDGESGLSDPDGFADMSAAEVLEALFEE